MRAIEAALSPIANIIAKNLPVLVSSNISNISVDNDITYISPYIYLPYLVYLNTCIYFGQDIFLNTINEDT